MDYLARKLIEKGENTVALRPETSFQYDQLAIIVIKQHLNFQKILLSHFFDKCPYLVPYYKPKLKNQSIESYFELVNQNSNKKKL